MIQKKICMLGSFAVGKTSLVRRYVDSLFSDKYHTTVGVKIDKKSMKVDDTDVMMMLWDLAGEDEFSKLNPSYLRGSSGFILVADGTRAATLDKALEIQARTMKEFGDTPYVLVLNKFDLADEWEVDEETVNELIRNGWTVLKSSAKTGDSVEEIFRCLAEIMMDCTTEQVS